MMDMIIRHEVRLTASPELIAALDALGAGIAVLVDRLAHAAQAICPTLTTETELDPALIAEKVAVPFPQAPAMVAESLRIIDTPAEPSALSPPVPAKRTPAEVSAANAVKARAALIAKTAAKREAAAASLAATAPAVTVPVPAARVALAPLPPSPPAPPVKETVSAKPFGSPDFIEATAPQIREWAGVRGLPYDREEDLPRINAKRRQFMLPAFQLKQFQHR